MSSGPVEQLRPTTSTSSAVSVVSTDWMSVPSSILPPFGSSETLICSGSVRPVSAEGLAGAEDRRLHLEDVLRGLDDDQVGAAVDQAARLLGEDLGQAAEGDVAEGRVGRGGQEAGRADRARDEAVRARRLAGDFGGLGVDLQRVLAEAPLLELQPRALEAVGLDHLGAGFQHRGVDALDHVGPVEDQRLVAFALQAAVVLLGQVELLQRRAHAAVEDDDPLLHRRYVVALRHELQRLPSA